MTQTARCAPNTPDLEPAAQEALAEARRRGASQAEAGASLDRGLSVTVRMGEVETLEHQRDRGLGITVYFGKRKGSASTADLAADAVRVAVAKACSIARFTAEDPHAGLAEAELMARELRELDLCHHWDLSPERAIELGRECEAVALGADARIDNSEGATVTSHWGRRVYANSHGFLGVTEGTAHSLSCVVLARENGERQRDYWYTAARDWRDLDDAGLVGARAAARALARLGAHKPATCRAPVLFPPELARGLIGHFVGAVSGVAQYRRSSFLLDAAGEQIFPRFVTISERPHLLKAMGSAAFDDEGVATHDRELVADGLLTGYVLGSYSARRLGLQSTGNAGGVHNLLVSAAGEVRGHDALLAGLDRGLVLCELMGQGVNPVTGDYSRGAAGFWVERGEIQFPVHEVTIAGNLREMYQQIAAVGTDVDVRGTIRCGSLLLEQMVIAGE